MKTSNSLIANKTILCLTMCNFMIITLPADGLASSDASASAGMHSDDRAPILYALILYIYRIGTSKVKDHLVCFMIHVPVFFLRFFLKTWTWNS